MPLVMLIDYDFENLLYNNHNVYAVKSTTVSHSKQRDLETLKNAFYFCIVFPLPFRQVWISLQEGVFSTITLNATIECKQFEIAHFHLNISQLIW